MSGRIGRFYWAALVLLSLFIGYEALTRQVYGDNSFWLAVVFFGIALLSCVRLASVGRAESRSSLRQGAASARSFLAGLDVESGRRDREAPHSRDLPMHFAKLSSACPDIKSRNLPGNRL